MDGGVPSQQHASELPVGRHRVAAIAGEDLYRDVVCPGVQMGAEPGCDDIGGAVEHERVDQAGRCPPSSMSSSV